MYSLFGSRQTRILLVHLAFAFCALFALADRVSVTLLSFRSVAYPPVVWPNGTWICFNISFRCLHFILWERERVFCWHIFEICAKSKKIVFIPFCCSFLFFYFLLPLLAMQMLCFIYHLLLTFMRIITPGTDIDLTLHPPPVGEPSGRCRDIAHR